MGNSENVFSFDKQKGKKENFKKKAVHTAREFTDNHSESLKESIKYVSDLGKDFSKSIRYGMGKRAETVNKMYDKAEDKAEREDIRISELKKSYCQYGLTGIGICCLTAVSITAIKSNTKLF